MSKLILTAAATASIVAGLALPGSQAAAQRSQAGEIIVYGTDPCPRATDDDVVVCRRRPEAERFRIPEVLRETGTLQQRQSWTRQAEALATAGATGVGSCSAVGPGGHTGCAQHEINRAFGDRREGDKAAVAPVK
ncbi:MAG: hypothetical protein M3R03_01010 [Pseudomonadota bacterium]|nr:hypothetical protein [Pseudomonadota bacterium]